MLPPSPDRPPNPPPEVDDRDASSADPSDEESAADSEVDDEVDSEDASDDDQDDEDETPQVLLATFGDLGSLLPDGLRAFASRPVWFMREEDQELATLFERLPEDPMPKGRAVELLRSLRNFAEESSDMLQGVLGIAEGIVYGFHGDASLDAVKRAFEGDGFFVWTGLVQKGELVVPEA